MGMFDTVRCEYPLPDSEFQDREFQSKSVCAAMCEYTITADGRLMQHLRQTEEVSLEETGKFGLPFFKRIPGTESLVPIPFDSDLFMYCYTDDPQNADREVITYRVRFEEGQVQSIKRVSGKCVPCYGSIFD